MALARSATRAARRAGVAEGFFNSLGRSRGALGAFTLWGWLVNSVLQIDETLKRLRTECQFALRSWALFEAANGYPNAKDAELLHNAINAHYEGWGINQIQKMVVRDVVSSLGRMTDRPNKTSKGNGRQSLGTVGQFLAQEASLEMIVRNARSWGSDSPDENERSVRQEHADTTARLSYEQTDIRNLGRIRAAIQEMRNNQIAHALNMEPIRLPRLFDVRDGLVFCVMMTKRCSMMIAGTNWNPEYGWREHLKEAKAFWNRYYRGFTRGSSL